MKLTLVILKLLAPCRLSIFISIKALDLWTVYFEAMQEQARMYIRAAWKSVRMRQSIAARLDVVIGERDKENVATRAEIASKGQMHGIISGTQSPLFPSSPSILGAMLICEISLIYPRRYPFLQLSVCANSSCIERHSWKFLNSVSLLFSFSDIVVTSPSPT